MGGETLTIDGHEIEVSNLDKVLFPKDGITKGDVIDYYRRVAETALPHFRDRPLSMQRFPDGIDKEGFFQKEAPGYFPDWIERVELPKEDGSVAYVVASTAATLAYLANQGCITPHLGLSRTTAIDRPDRIIFDLDPADDDFSKVRWAAMRIKDLLEEVGLAAFAAATGSRGLHVVVPLDRSADFDTVRDSARGVAQQLARRHPDALTVEHRKEKRGDRVFLDYLRNAYGQTAVAPYGVRAKDGAPVAAPLDWSEVASKDFGPRRYTIQNIFRRLGRKHDPWAGIDRAAAAAERARERLEEEFA